MVRQLSVHTRGQGLVEVTRLVAEAVAEAKIAEGLCTVFVRHTSASLVIQENADPTAKQDLERWLNRLAPEGDPFYKHDADLAFHPHPGRQAGPRHVAGRVSLGTPAPRRRARAGVAHRHLSR